jgi:hypothetical protein
MNPDDFFLRRWRNLFHPEREFILRWLTPSQRAALIQRMNADYCATIDHLLGTDDGKPGSD